jgi:hypothetical protein
VVDMVVIGKFLSTMRQRAGLTKGKLPHGSISRIRPFRDGRTAPRFRMRASWPNWRRSSESLLKRSFGVQGVKEKE